MRFKVTVFLTAVAILLSGSSVNAFFQDGARGVRPAGMGESFVSIADDANTVLYNPAGFARIPGLELTAMYSDLYTGLRPILYTGSRDRLGYNFLSLAVPVEKQIGSFGASWTQLLTSFYTENTYTVSYARSLWQPMHLDMGVNVKLLSWSVGNNDYTDQITRTGITADVGAIINPLPHLQVGLAIDNIIPADVGVDQSEIVPLAMRVGSSYMLNFSGMIVDSIQLQVEVATRNVTYEKGGYNIKLGGETWLMDHLLALRMGVNKDLFSTGLGFVYPMAGNYGLQLDYAFTFPFELRYNSGSHRIGLSLNYAKPKVMVKPVATPAPTPEPTPVVVVEKELEEKLIEVQKKIEVGELKPIYFDVNNSTIKEIPFATLDYLGSILEKYPSLKVRIEGHSDALGDDAYNQKLSQSRVESTCSYLSEKFKIPAENLVPKGCGAAQPIADNRTAEGRAKNRRVEFHVISQNEEDTKITINEESTQVTIETEYDMPEAEPASSVPMEDTTDNTLDPRNMTTPLMEDENRQLDPDIPVER